MFLFSVYAGQRPQQTRGEFNNAGALSAHCTDARLYTLGIKIGTGK